MPLLDAQQILAADDKQVRKVPVPEWGKDAKVLVGSMGALDRARLEDWVNTLGKSPAPESQSNEVSEESDDLVTCDSAEPKSKETESPPAAVEKVYSREDNMAVMVRWCAACILDPASRRRAFSDEQVEQLGAKSPAALLRVYQAALDLNLATRESAKAFEKNSEGTSGADSGGD